MNRSFTLIEVILILLIVCLMVDLSFSIFKLDYDLISKQDIRGENY